MDLYISGQIIGLANYPLEFREPKKMWLGQVLRTQDARRDLGNVMLDSLHHGGCC